MARTQKHSLTSYEVEAHVKQHVRITIVASSEDEARKKFEAMKWGEVQTLETVDWEFVSIEKEKYPF
jgi:hypothetical protein